MKIQFFLTNGAVVEWPVPPDWGTLDFEGLCKIAKSYGYFQARDVHIPYDRIMLIGLHSDGASIAVTMPEHATRQ